jgi:1A family penicillin-binding protein
MSSPKSPKPKTRLTQLLQSVPARIQFSRLKLKANARVPELRVQGPDDPEPQVYPLLGERFLMGRSSQNCDIIVRNAVVSQVHASLTRDRRPAKIMGILPGRQRFVIADEGSTNGIYNGKKRVKKVTLYDGDVLTLAPADLDGSVRIQYLDPPAWYIRAIRMGVLGLAGLSTLMAGAIALYWSQFSVYPIPNTVQGPTLVYDRDGTPLTDIPVNKSHVDVRSLGDVSKFLPQAVMASEDSRFYWHVGVDPLGTTRAVVTNFRSGGIKEGASTITQQLARNLMRSYVGTEDSAGRKIKEAMVALKLEATYSKDELMRLYLSRVYLGHGNFGFEDAAQFYFGKSAQKLDLNESATLAGILPAPSAFNPVKDAKTAREYRDRVLERMAEQGRVSPEEANRARRSPIDLSPKAREILSKTIAPYYYSSVIDELADQLGDSVAQEGNFIIETALDLKMQRQAEEALKTAIETRGASNGYKQGAIVTLNAETGEILALVGGYDYAENQFNRATQAQRQPGSTFKIFAYTPALEKGANPGTGYSCAPLTWDGFTFEGCASGGAVAMQTGIAQSYNVVALRAAQEVGLDEVIRTAKRMGVHSKLTATPGLVLGQSETTVLEMTSAFGVLANSGARMRPRTIQRIIDTSDCTTPSNTKTCRVLYDASKKEVSVAVLDPTIADTMTQMLRGVVQGGTGRGAAIGLDVAGKTGTTNSGVDLWFIGYVPSRKIVTGIWLGNDDNTPTGDSSAQAATLWGEYMRQAMR